MAASSSASASTTPLPRKARRACAFPPTASRFGSSAARECRTRSPAWSNDRRSPRRPRNRSPRPDRRRHRLPARRPLAMARVGDAIVVLGEVIAAYGVRGALKIRPYTEAPDALLGYATWWLKMSDSRWREWARRGGRIHSGALLVELEGVDSREAALALKG